MPTYTITGPDGKDYSIDGPEGATREQVVAAIKSRMAAAPVTPASPRSDGKDHAGAEHAARIKAAASDVVKSKSSLLPGIGLGEAALEVTTGLGSSIVGGLAGLARTAVNIPTEGFDKAMELGGRTATKIQENFTYHPRTPVGKLASEILQIPSQAGRQMGRAIGGDTGEFIGGTLGEELSGAEGRRTGAIKGRGIGESVGEILPDSLLTVAGAKPAMRTANAIAERVKVAIPGKDFTPLRDLTPEQQERMRRFTDQNIEPTLGQVTRDPQQFRFEDQTAKTEVGADLRTRELDTNDALIAAIKETDSMRPGVGLEENRRMVGSSVARALEENAKQSLEGVDAKYNAARESGETNAVIDTTKLKDYLEEKAPDALTVTALKSIEARLAKLDEMRGGRITIDDVESIYQSANQLSKDASASHFMGEVKAIINDITEGVGGDLYREARKSRLEHALEYEDRSAIADLIDKKPGSRTDYKTKAEDVFDKTVVRSSLEELKDVTNSLLSKDPAKSPQSWQAIREIQAETINWLLEKATARGVLNEREVPGLSPTALRDAVKEIGADKLNWILGPEAVARLMDTMENARAAKQAPGKVQGSDTHINNRDYAERALMAEAAGYLFSKVPGLNAAAAYVARRKANKQMQSDIGDALNPRRAAAAEIAEMRGRANAERRIRLYTDSIDLAYDTVPAALVTTANTAELAREKKRASAQKTMQKLSNLGHATSIDEAIQAVQP